MFRPVCPLAVVQFGRSVGSIIVRDPVHVFEPRLFSLFVIGNLIKVFNKQGFVFIRELVHPFDEVPAVFIRDQIAAPGPDLTALRFVQNVVVQFI